MICHFVIRNRSNTITGVPKGYPENIIGSVILCVIFDDKGRITLFLVVLKLLVSQNLEEAVRKSYY
jgi:hypothetical protein